MGITRRSFLSGALGAGALAAGATGVTGVLAGCSPTPAKTPTSRVTTSTESPSPTGPPPPPDWAALRGQLAGQLLVSGDQGYDTARLGYNPVHDDHHPVAVARCANPDDVRRCVELAGTAKVPIAARSGGHSYGGYSTPDNGIVVDLGKLADVQVRGDGTAVVGAGARLIDVYAALAAAGRCLPAGSCPTVGVAGLTLGGGVGVLTRKFGLTCDRATSMQVVTADAQLRTASPDSEPDLYWALRGGGGGNLGVVTSFTFRTEPAPDLAVFSLHFPAGSAAAVLGGWQHWVADAPDELWSNCVISAGNPATVRVGGCFVGSTSGLAPLLDRLVRAAGTTPTSRYSDDLGYLDTMRYMAGCSQYSVAQCRLQGDGAGQLDRESFVASARVLQTPVADPATVVATLAGRTGIDLLFDSLGGAVSRVAPDATAFPHRTALATVQIYGATQTSTRPETTRAVGEVRDALGDLLGRASYVNYIDPALPRWADAYYGANLERLRRAVQSYDPQGVFSFVQGLTKI